MYVCMHVCMYLMYLCFDLFIFLLQLLSLLELVMEIRHSPNNWKKALPSLLRECMAEKKKKESKKREREREKH